MPSGEVPTTVQPDSGSQAASSFGVARTMRWLKMAPRRAAHGLGVVGVGALAHEDDAVAADGIVVADQRAEVARMLHFVEHEPAAARLRHRLQRLRALTHDGADRLRLFAKGDDVEEVRRHLEDGHVHLVQRLGQRCLGVVEAVGRDDQQFDDGAGLQRRLHDTMTLDEERAGAIALPLLAQGTDGLDAVIASAGDDRHACSLRTQNVGQRNSGLAG